MAPMKVTLNGKRVAAEDGDTVLQVARRHGVAIPTLCHDDQLEPFASCFLCVVNVQGAKSLLPACTTKATPGMVVETDTAEVHRSRKAALELLLSNHFADCIGPCQLACPASVDIQGYVALAALGDYAGAVQLIKERNPLPSICGRVCTRPCEVTGCRRNLLDSAVGIDYIKRYVADLHLGLADPPRADVAPPNGSKVAVVGAGPAGLSCAYYLALRGYAVDMFENMPESGGMLRYGIPEYRLPKDVLDLEVDQILDLGVKLHTNRELGRDFTVASLRRDGYGAVFLGLGAWQSQAMRVEDENAEGVLSGIDFLRAFGLRRRIDIHGRVLVVGGGNTAIDCARTALRLGVKEVRVLYRRTRAEMPANDVEIEEAVHEGVQFDYLVAPTRIVTQDGRLTGVACTRMELGEPDASGRRSPVPVAGSEFVTEADFVLAAIGQSSKMRDLLSGGRPELLPAGESLDLTRWSTVAVNDRTMETSVEGVFSGGDVVTGAATAVEAIAAGRKAAHAIDSYIRTGMAQPEPREFLSRKDTFRTVTLDDLRSQESVPRREMQLISLDTRRSGFTEVERGYTADDVRAETNRCLECGCVALFDCDLRRYASEYDVDVTKFLGEATEYKVDRSHPLIELDPSKCILCGRCVRMCSEVVGANAYGFVKRGFATMVRPELSGSLLDTDCVSCGMCIGTCPTGAISARVPIVKPGPWKTSHTVSTCHYCSVGCQLEYRSMGSTVVDIGRVEDAPHTYGNQCSKGMFGHAYLQSAERIVRARIREGDELRDADLDEAITRTAVRLKEYARGGHGDEVAVFVSPRLTNEEAYLAQKLARVALGTNNVASFANLVNAEFACHDVVSTATYHDLVGADGILVVNAKPAREHFTVDLLVKRAVRAGAGLVVVGPDEDGTAAIADVHLKCLPGTQPWVVLALVAELARRGAVDLSAHPEVAAQVGAQGSGEAEARAGIDAADLVAAADVLVGAKSRVVVFNKDHRGPRVPGDDRLFAAAARAMGGAHLALSEKANMQGLLDMGAHPDWLPGYRSRSNGAVEELEKDWGVVLQDLRDHEVDLVRALSERRIRAAVVIGEDPLGNEMISEALRDGLRACEFLVVADVMLTATAKAASVVLPLAAAPETSGTYTNAEHRVQRVRRSVVPRGGVEGWQLLDRIAARMGLRSRMKYATTDEVFEEIRRVVPLYRDVDPDSPDGRAVWDAAALELEIGPLPDVGAATAEPLPTLPLDDLERRFGARMRQLFADARSSHVSTRP
jgi:formate dehydrogenase major subunit